MKRILIAEGVPLQNRGEEAIVRGIADFLFENEKVEIAVMDFVDNSTYFNDIKVFPITLLYPFHRPMRTQVMNLPDLSFFDKIRKYYNLFSFLWGDYGSANQLLRKNNLGYKELREYIEGCDYVFFGHDGAWGISSVPVFIVCRRYFKAKTGILGSGFNPITKGLRGLIERVAYRKAISLAHFAFFRETKAFQYMKSLSLNNPLVKITPDPAFGMKYESLDLVDKFFSEGYPIIRASKDANKLIVVVTVCENSVVFKQSFLQAENREEKTNIHNRLIAYLLDELIVRYQAFIVFLPHTKDEGRGNDVLISSEVLDLMQYKSEAVVITDDLDARFLKAIIKWADFLLGERTHSIIGALSVATPFGMLTNIHDHRSYSIIGEVGDCKEMLLNIEKDRQVLIDDISILINNRGELHHKLIHKSNVLKQRLIQVRDEIL